MNPKQILVTIISAVSLFSIIISIFWFLVDLRTGQAINAVEIRHLREDVRILNGVFYLPSETPKSAPIDSTLFKE